MYNSDPEGAKRIYPLERGWVKHQLIRELAQGIKSQAKLADDYGVAFDDVRRVGADLRITARVSTVAGARG